MSNPIVAFQGEPGAYSQEAAQTHFGSQVQTLACESFQAIFEAIRSGQATNGILPVENALAGTVAQTYELLMEYDFRVQGEVILPIHHNLMVPPGTALEDIQRVRSHPQALAQCAHYLRRRGWQPVASYDTAGAAQELAANPVLHTAVLASRLAAELYQLTILESSVEDEPHNSTRFFVLGTEDIAPTPGEPTKTSLVFTFRDRAGALFGCLSAFAQHNINLTKIESRPVRGRAWQYWFFLDFEGYWSEPAVEAALVELLRQATFVKILGSYPASNEGPKPA
ncbi:MAG: prephenate dehydratase [Anaerolineae bacterium]|nr:prephenate dehydratase [Anaerolineae bacterium]